MYVARNPGSHSPTYPVLWGSCVGRSFALTITPVDGSRSVGFASAGSTPVQSYSPVHPGTGICPSPFRAGS